MIIAGFLLLLAIIFTIIGSPGQAGGVDRSDSAQDAFLQLGLWFTILTTVILGPIIEELVFRGVLFGALLKRFSLKTSVLLSSLAFMLVHLNPVSMLSALPLGIYLAIMYRRTGSIIPGMILHMTWSLMITAILLLPA